MSIAGIKDIVLDYAIIREYITKINLQILICHWAGIGGHDGVWKIVDRKHAKLAKGENQFVVINT